MQDDIGRQVTIASSMWEELKGTEPAMIVPLSEWEAIQARIEKLEALNAELQGSAEGSKMNDVERTLRQLWRDKESGVVGNTAIVDGVLLLHNTAIARREAGEVHVSLGGFDTKITRSRLKTVVGAEISRVMGKTAVETTDGIKYMQKHEWYRIK